jgi:hypothetical protein
MPAIKLEQFGGMLPAWDNHLLSTGQGAQSVNAYLFSGRLEGWRMPKLLRALNNSAARYVYRIPTISETQALAYLVYQAQPANGDTFTIGDDTYTYRTALTGGTGLPFEILIGSSTLNTAVNTVAAITLDYGAQTNAGIAYGQNTTPNADVILTSPLAVEQGFTATNSGVAAIGSQSLSYVVVGAQGFGAAYNNINVSVTGVNLLFLKDLLSLSDTTTSFAGGTNPSFVNDITGPATWLEFLDQDTNVLKSQVADDSFDRFFTASPSQEPQYNTRNRITSGKPFFNLGVPPPGCAPTVNVTGGGNALTLGNSVLLAGGVDIFGAANAVFLMPITPTGATQINDIQFALDGNSNIFISLGGNPPQANSVNFAAVIYSDQGGVPENLLGVGAIVTGVVGSTTGNNLSAFTNPVTLLAGTQYWIGIITDTALPYLPAGPGLINNMVDFSQPFTNGPPATAPAAININQPGFLLFADCVSADVQEARSYVYTWVSAYGEEGPPSPPTLVNGWSNGTWTIGLWTPPPDDLGVFRNLAVLRLYRTVTAVGGSTVYYWVADVSLGSTDPDAVLTVAQNPLVPPMFTDGVQSSMPTGINPPSATYVDTNPDNLVALNIQMPSTNWFPPPANLQGIVSLPNGMFVGWIGNAVWFCEPYQFHAWPPGYVITTDFPIVGLGVANGAIIVATAARPYVIIGVAPASMSSLKCSKAEPCNSRGSILDGDAAVCYMSPNGLIQVTPNGQVQNTTQLWITRERWDALTPPRYARAISLASCYFCYGTTSPLGVVPSDNSQAQTGFTIELDQDNASFTIWPQPGGHRLGFDTLTAPNGYNVDNVLTDPWTGIGLLIQNQNVYYYDFTDQQPIMQPYAWASKIYQQNTKKSYEAMKVFFDQPAGPTGPAFNIPTPYGATLPTGTTAFQGFTGLTGYYGPSGNTGPNQAIASDVSWNTLNINQLGIIKTFVDYDGTGRMVLVDCREITNSGGLLRIISGFKAEQWMWQISGRIRVSNVQIATTAKELGNV